MRTVARKTKNTYPELRKAMADQYGIVFTPRQLERLATEPGDRRDLAIDSTDTATRESFGTGVVWDVLGKGRYWPMYGDGPDAGAKFFFEFFPAAERKGYKLAPWVANDLKRGIAERCVTLRKQIADRQHELCRLEALDGKER